MRKLKTVIVTVVIVLTAGKFAYTQNISKRNIISLHGNWEIAEGTKDIIPKSLNIKTGLISGLISKS